MTDSILTRAAYPLEEARQLLGGVTRQHLYNLADRGEIRLVKLGRRTLVPASEIERLTTTQGSSDVSGRVE